MKYKKKNIKMFTHVFLLSIVFDTSGFYDPIGMIL